MGTQRSVANILGESIYLSDLTPNDDETKVMMNTYPELSKEEAIQKFINRKLSSRMINKVTDDFNTNHEIEPTKKEVEGFTKAINPTSHNEPSEMQDMYASFVRKWKLSKALYEKNGGEVIFQQGKPNEPIGAWRERLTLHEKNGDLSISDEHLISAFWKPFVKKQSFKIPQDKIDFSKPWWVKEVELNIKLGKRKI